MTNPVAERSPNPQSLDRSVLLIADDIGVFLAIARSLGRAGIAVDVATSENPLPGFASRYVRTVHRVPGYLTHPEDWLRAVEALDQEHDFGWIVPTSDSSLIQLQRLADTLPTEKLALPNREAIDLFSDKAATRQLAERTGVPVARGIQVARGSSRELIGQRLRFPVIVKPSHSYRPGDHAAKLSPVIAHDEGAAEASLARFAGRELLVEEIFEGEGVGVSVLAERGQIAMAWQHRRLAETSPTGRSSARRGETVDPRLLDDVQRLCRESRLSGVAMFEFRQDRGSGRHVLLEVNPRFWGSLALAVAAGWNFPLAYRQLACGSNPRLPATGASPSIKRVDLWGEFERITHPASHSVTDKARALGGAIRLALMAIAAPQRFDSWAEDDPAPHSAQIRRIATYVSGAIRRAIMPLRR